MNKKQERADAKIASSINAMRKTLVAASAAAHELKRELEEDGEDDSCDRMLLLGCLTDAASTLCAIAQLERWQLLRGRASGVVR